MGAHPTRLLRPALRAAAARPGRPPARGFAQAAHRKGKKPTPRSSPTGGKNKKGSSGSGISNGNRISSGNRANCHRASIFHDQVTDKNNASDNEKVLGILQSSAIDQLSVQDCTLFLNQLIRNKRSKHRHSEMKDAGKVKLTSSLYKEAIKKIIRSVLTFEERYFCFFFQRFSELRDLNAMEQMLLHMHTKQLFRSFTLYHLTDVIYYVAILNFEREKSEEALETILGYLLSNAIRANGYVRHLERRLVNHAGVQGADGKPVYIRSSAKRREATRKESTRKEAERKNATTLVPHTREGHCTPQFDVNSLSNVMLHKLIYGLAKINRKRALVRELLTLLVPYIRFQLQTKHYVFSSERPDVIVKVLWSYAFLHVRHVNLFVDFSLCIQVAINQLQLDQLKIVKNIFLNFFIFDELLLDTLEERIGDIEEKWPGPLSQPRKKPFKKKKRRVALTDQVKLRMQR
ncbi:conserved protein, unknown function [Plasmodium vivax]|uniref:Uncharacterized protein n=1 Tax=Plasmodium vivax TaxID=5855 RepID=A0A564ZNN7_PLAVI|nr:conserved protein, unknown function [Plasmodium vivax]